jgi:hypothetical protein
MTGDEEGAAYAEIVRRGCDRDGFMYPPEALATFPPYNVLNAIRVELEFQNHVSLPLDTAITFVNDLLAGAAIVRQGCLTIRSKPARRSEASAQEDGRWHF